MANMKYTFPIFGFLLLTIATAGAQVASHAPTVLAQPPASGSLTATGKAVVRVNDTILTDADLVREEYAIFPYARQHNGLPKEMATQIRDGAMKMLVFEELVYQEALRRKMTVPVAKLQSAEVDFRKQFATPDEFNAFLQTELHGSQKLLDEKIRRSLLIDTFLKAEVDKKSEVTPVELKAFYDKNPARFEHPELFTFQTISILPPANATAGQLKEGHKRAEDALHKAKATKSSEEFGLLAEKASDDDYRVVMGQHKPVAGDKLAPQVLKALTAMKAGDVSDVIQIDQAYTIVRLGQHSPAGLTKFEEVKPQLEKELHQTKTNQLRAGLDKKLRENAKVEEL
jgi:parvulin-like peptidyl-prolyl isomerase